MKLVNEFKSDITFHPGVTLAEKLFELAMNSEQFAKATGIAEDKILGIIMCIEPITEEYAELFERELHIPARFWLKQQSRFDQWK